MSLKNDWRTTGTIFLGWFKWVSFQRDLSSLTPTRPTPHTPNPHLWLELVVHCSIRLKSQEAYIVFIPLGDGSFLGGGLSVGFTLFSPLNVLPWIFWLITDPSFFPLETLWKKQNSKRNSTDVKISQIKYKQDKSRKYVHGASEWITVPEMLTVYNCTVCYLVSHN